MFSAHFPPVGTRWPQSVLFKSGSWGLPWWLSGKNPPANAEDPGSILDPG